MKFKKTITKTAELHIESKWKWIAKDKNGEVYLYNRKPSKSPVDIWQSGGDSSFCIALNPFFHDISWGRSLISVAAFRKKHEVK